MRRLLYPGSPGVMTSLGILLVRVVAGAALALHGWPKIQHPLNWMPADMAMPSALQACAALSEFAGGIALVLGVLSRVAAAGIAVTMGVAAGMVHIPAGHAFVASKPGEPAWELAAIYFASAVLVLLAGPGRFSVDARLFGRTG